MKFYVRTISPLFLLVVLSLCGSQQAFGLCGKRSCKAPAEQRDTTKSSAYDKFFKEEHRIARGLFTLHEMKGRVYFEIPLRLMDRSMLLGTTISATSDNGHGIVGSKPKDPLHFAFTRAGDRIAMRLISERTVPPLPDHAEIGRALATSNIGAIYRLFKIETFTPDSSAVVVDATNLFVSDDERLSPFDKYSQHTLSGRLKRKESFEKEKSYVTGIKSFSDNVSVSSSLNYRVTISERGLRDVPVTIAATRSILLLDSLPVSPRITDSRIAVFPTGKMLYSPTTQGARPIWYANRWRLEPSDIEAYRRGELVDPVKPIVFYIDRNFPRTWLPYVIEGVNQWSELFEQIGFRNAVQARLFPEDDPEFDPDNLKYSCIRYVPAAVANAMGPSWVDPRSGEIINASVLMYNDVVRLANTWRFVQTSQVDERVRGKELPDDVFQETLEYILAHEVGHTLGLMHNMAASSAFPVDSLRSASFTQKHGTTPSIMDYARFNYVAQPGDRGVKVTPPDLGPYDEYVIKYAYTPLPDKKDMFDEEKTIRGWIDEKVGDPIYRYGRQQLIARYDPTALEEDLGDDAMKAGDYGIANLKYILSHMEEWIPDEEDPDLTKRIRLYEAIAGQFARYVNAAMLNVGGIYLKQVNSNTPGGPQAVAVPKERQRAALKWVLAQMKDSSWLEQPALTEKLPLHVDLSSILRFNFCRAFFTYYKNVMLSSHISDNPYTPQEYMNDLYNIVFENTIKGRSLSPSERLIQRMFVDASADVAASEAKRLKLGGIAEAYAPSVDEIALLGLDDTGLVERYLTPLREAEEEHGKGFVASKLWNADALSHGYGWQYNVQLRSIDESRALFVSVNDRILKLLRSREKNASGETRAHYQGMIYVLERSMFPSQKN